MKLFIWCHFSRQEKNYLQNCISWKLKDGIGITFVVHIEFEADLVNLKSNIRFRGHPVYTYNI